MGDEWNEDGAEEGTEETPIIRALRKQIKLLKRDLATAPKEEDLIPVVRAMLERERDATELLSARGHKGLRDYMLGELGKDEELTGEAVDGWLSSKGYDITPS